MREDKPVSFALVETKPAAQVAKFELALSSGEVLRIPADVESLRAVFEALRVTGDQSSCERASVPMHGAL